MCNRVVVVGRLTRDPELRTTSTGKDVVEFSIAVNKRIKPADGPDADFFRVKAWGQTASYVGEYIGRGRLVSVDGRLESRKYTDKEGNNREIVEIVADHVNALDRPREDAEPRQESRGKARPPQGEEYDPFADED
jgi:single-strand DNA-binding protein